MFNNIVTIQKKDANTGEIKEEISSTNSQTLGSIQHYLSGAQSWSDSLITFSPDTRTPRMWIQLRNEVDLENVINEATMSPREIPGDNLKTEQITGENQPKVAFDTVNKTVEYEFNGRINPPATGTSRSITSVELAMGDSDGNFGGPGFAVILTSPCEQTDTEILDVLYRVRITGDVNSNDYYWATYMPNKFFQGTTYDSDGNSLGGGGAPNVIGPNIIPSYGYPNSRDKMPVSYFGGTTSQDNSEGFSDYNLTQLTGIKNWSYDLEEQIGQTYRSLNFFSSNEEKLNPNAQQGFVSNSSSSLYQFSHQLLPDDINPLQGQFLHKADAIRPYLDPSSLGSGQGDITFDGSNWNEDESVVYRLQFTTAGDVGTAEYKLLKKIIFGYPSNEYIHEFWAGKRLIVLPSQRLFNDNVSTRQALNKPDSYWAKGSTADFIHFEDDFFDNGVMPNVIRYDDKHVISFDTTGLSIVNIYTDDYFNIDSQSTPALNTNAINDVIVNEINGEIWVATTDAGLFRISSDFQTVTPITVGTASITDTTCRSVDYKNNGDIWAAFSGGLALSTDNGATWTEFNEGTTPQFSFTGISDNNWGSIQGIVVDKDSADDRLLIVKIGDRSTTRIIWWSRAGSSTTSDAVDSTINPHASTGVTSQSAGEFYDNVQAFAVSKWIKYYPGTNGTFFILSNYQDSNFRPVASSAQYRTVNFGGTQNRGVFTVTTTSHDTPRMKDIAFEQDSTGTYGTIILGQPAASTNSRWAVNLLDPDFTLLEQWNDWGWSNREPAWRTATGFGGSSFYHTYMGKGIGIFCSSNDYNIVNRMFSDTSPFGDSKFDLNITNPGDLTFADANPDTITRNDGGDWLADEVVAGDVIIVSNSVNGDNDGSYTIDNVTATTLTLIASDSLVAATNDTSATIEIERIFTSKRSLMWEEYGWDGSQWVLGNLNSRVVHSTQEPLIDGLEVQFADVGSPNFVLDEYVDINVFKGIHNDNATEFSYSVPVTVRNSSVLEDLSQNTVPSSSFGTVSNKKLNFITNTGVPTDTSERIYNVDGIIGQWMSSTTNGNLNVDNIDHTVFSEIVFDGDFSISFKTTKDGRVDNDTIFSSIGMLPLSFKGLSTSYADPNYLFEFDEREFRVKSGTLGTDTTFAGPTTISSKDDVYTMERVGTDLNFRLNGTILHTFSGVSDALIVQAGFLNEGFRTFFDMNIDSYTENGLIVELGDSVNSTGVFDPRFAMIEAYLDPTTSSFSIDGVDAPITTDPHIDPPSGSVTLYSKAGWVKFNSADAGSSITGNYQVLYGFN